MDTPTEKPATSPEFSDEAIIAAEQVARGRRGSHWFIGCLVWLGGGAVICAGTVAVWVFLPVSQTMDIAIYRQQKAILAEAEAAMGDPVAMQAVAARHGHNLQMMASDLGRRLNPSAPHRKFLMWNAKYRFAEITGSDPTKSTQATLDYEANLKQAAMFLGLKD